MKKILITGGTGFIGKALVQYILDSKPEAMVVALTRNPEQNKADNPRVKYVFWDIENGKMDSTCWTDVDTVLHLAGAGIADKRWTSKRKKVIMDSRINGSLLLLDQIGKYGKSVETLVSASSVGWYGEDKKEKGPFVETDYPDTSSFLGQVCKDWETCLLPLKTMGKRLVHLRTGIVLGPDGGMWKNMEKSFRLGVAPIFDHGKQIISWIGLDDLCKLYIFCAENIEVSGPVNAVTPNPVNQKELSECLVKKYYRHYVKISFPKWALKLMVGELSKELTKSTTVSSQKIEDLGFKFAISHVAEL